MSAIAGLYRADDQPEDRRGVARMMSALVHRRPNSSGVWSGAPEVTITADVRLDNRRELTALLGIAGGAAASIPDSELIRRAYLRWDADCVARLTGDFALAIWDGRTRTLFCARDHIGVKPFYYYHAPGILVFASEIKALLTNPAVPYRLNPLRVADHLVGLIDVPAITFYRDIFRLPAGHTLTASRGGTRIESYWSFDPSRELALGSDDAYTAAFLESFTEAVRCRLEGGEPVGCLLSGGLDTSSIVGVARRIRRQAGEGPLDTFTAIFPGLPAADLRRIDERAFDDALVAQGDLEPHYVRGDLLGPLADVDRALWHLDEPFPAPNLYLHWALYGAARDCGVRVLLDGIDGDTTVSHGLENFAALARRGKVLTLARELRGLSRRYSMAVSGLLRQFAVQPLVPVPVRHAVRRLRGCRESAHLDHTAIRPEFARQTAIVERVEAYERRCSRPVRTAREAHCRGMNSGLIPYALEMADKAAAAFGIEPRYPFFDRRLMELCLALPPDLKLRGGWTRLVMRRAMDGILPEEVRWRPSKANLAPNFRQRLVAHDRTLVEEVVLGQPGALGEYVDIPALRRIYQRYLAEPTSDAHALTVYCAVVLTLWLQRTKAAA